MKSVAWSGVTVSMGKKEQGMPSCYRETKLAE
jgi:hypothetical protein